MNSTTIKQKKSLYVTVTSTQHNSIIQKYIWQQIKLSNCVKAVLLVCCNTFYNIRKTNQNLLRHTSTQTCQQVKKWGETVNTNKCGSNDERLPNTSVTTAQCRTVHPVLTGSNHHINPTQTFLLDNPLRHNILCSHKLHSQNLMSHNDRYWKENTRKHTGITSTQKIRVKRMPHLRINPFSRKCWRYTHLITFPVNRLLSTQNIHIIFNFHFSILL